MLLTRKIENWYVVDRGDHKSVSGRLYVDGDLRFSQFDTYNPTVVATDEKSCYTAGAVYALGRKKDD